MAIKRYKPTSSARRFMTVSAYDEITTAVAINAANAFLLTFIFSPSYFTTGAMRTVQFSSFIGKMYFSSGLGPQELPPRPSCLKSRLR